MNFENIFFISFLRNRKRVYSNKKISFKDNKFLELALRFKFEEVKNYIIDKLSSLEM